MCLWLGLKISVRALGVTVVMSVKPTIFFVETYTHVCVCQSVCVASFSRNCASPHVHAASLEPVSVDQK